jgi:hypothetical protein
MKLASEMGSESGATSKKVTEALKLLKGSLIYHCCTERWRQG